MAEETRHIPPDQDLFTIKEVAVHMQVSSWTVYQWRNKGMFKAYKPGGGRWRVRREELLRLLGERSSLVEQAPSTEDTQLAQAWIQVVGREAAVKDIISHIIELAADDADDDDIRSLTESLSIEDKSRYRRALQRAAMFLDEPPHAP
jgi:excisionase family DNA binding protein